MTGHQETVPGLHAACSVALLLSLQEQPPPPWSWLMQGKSTPRCEAHALCMATGVPCRYNGDGVQQPHATPAVMHSAQPLCTICSYECCSAERCSASACTVRLSTGMRSYTQGNCCILFISNQARPVTSYGQVPKDPYARPTDGLRGPPKDITLYQYEVCPFCCKVKAMLDYYKVGDCASRWSLGRAACLV